MLFTLPFTGDLCPEKYGSGGLAKNLRNERLAFAADLCLEGIFCLVFGDDTFIDLVGFLEAEGSVGAFGGGVVLLNCNEDRLKEKKTEVLLMFGCFAFRPYICSKIIIGLERT